MAYVKGTADQRAGKPGSENQQVGSDTTFDSMAFGSRNKPGWLGTGQYGVDSYDIDKSAYYDNSGLQNQKDQSQALLNQSLNRQGPQAQAAQLGRAQNVQAAQGQAALGTAINANQTQLGTAQNVNQANINRQDEQFRNQQAGLANRLDAASQGQGPSVAASQLGQANAAATAQRMAAAASDRGFGNTAATNRQLAYQQGAAQQANAIASAQTRMQEQQAAQQALGNVLSSSRGQDIGVNTSQAQLGQQANLANQAAQNQFALQQAEMNQQTALQNAAAGNQFGLANQNALNQQSQLNQNSQNQFSLANQAVNNQFALQNNQNQQQVNLANQAAQLQQMGLNDAQVRAMLGTNVGIEQQVKANQQAYNQLGVEQNTALQQLQQKAYNDAAQASSSLTGGILGGLAALSDEREKDNVSKVDDFDIDKFLNPYADKNRENQLLSSNPYKDRLDQNPYRSNMNSREVNLTDSNPYNKEEKKPSGFGQFMSILGGAMSDERQKKNIKHTEDDDVEDFLDNINGNKYQYKNPNMLGADNKTHYSPMAQELEKSDIGRSMVYNKPDGTKMVDYGRGFGALMATTANLNKRLNDLEKKK